jgi:hypothetical protein
MYIEKHSEEPCGEAYSAAVLSSLGTKILSISNK